MNALRFPTGLPTSPTPQLTAVVRKPRKRELKNLMKRDGIWYFEKRVNGKKEYNGRRTPFTLDTRDLGLAKAKRDAIIKAASGAEIDRILGKEHRGAATLGEIITAYLAGPTIKAKADTRKENITDLKRFVRTVRGADFTVEDLSTTELTKQFVKTWQAKRLETASQEHAEDLAALEAAKRSMNSMLTHVQSIFSAQAIDDYGTLHLPPNVAEFAKAGPVAARKQGKPVQLKDEVVQQLLADAVALQGEDPGAWAMFQLMTWGGLRNRECAHAEKAWLDQEPLGYRLTMKPTKTFLPKGNERSVILPAAIAEALLAQVPAGDDHLVPATSKSDRIQECERRLNAWLKARGVTGDAGKIAYRLRKFFLNKIKEQQGLMMAQAAAGHSSSRTTQDHYVGQAVMSAPVKLG